MPSKVGRRLVNLSEATAAGLLLFRDYSHASFESIIRALLRERARKVTTMDIDEALEAYAAGEMTAEELEAMFPGVFDLESELDRDEVD